MAEAGSVRVVLDQSRLAPFLAEKSKASAYSAGKAVERRARLNLIALGRVRTGRMLRSYYTEIEASTGAGSSVRVGNSHPAYQWQENGRGWVYPRRARLLRFRPKGVAGYVYARKVRPVRPGRMLARAFAELTVNDFRVDRRF